MHDFCVKHIQEPPWIVKKKTAPTGAMSGNSAFIWDFFNNGLTLVKESHVKNVAIAEGFNGGFEWDGLHGSSQAYSFSINRPIHPLKLDCHDERPKRCREVDFRLLGGFCAGCLEVDKIGMGEWRGEVGIVCNEDVDCTSSDWTRSRRWSVHLKKTRLRNVYREKRKGVTAKRNKLAKK